MELEIGRRRMWAAVGCFLVSLLAWGCVTTGDVEEVRTCDVRLLVAVLTDMPGDSVSIRIGVEVRNPNMVPVQVARLDADLFALGERLVSMTIPGPLQISPAGREILETSIELPVTEVNESALANARSSGARFGVEGRLYIVADGRDYSFRVSSYM